LHADFLESTLDVHGLGMRENRLPVTLDYLIDRIGRCGRDQASDANDAGAGGNGQKMSPRRIYGRSYAILGISLSHFLTLLGLS